MVYFGQDGCPYCRQLMVTNFSQRAIVDKMRRHFVAIALNIWGDRETTWIDGRMRTEKALARYLDVQFTPTLLFLDEKGSVVARLNGYWPPHRFEAALDYVATKQERRETLAAYLARKPPEAARATLAEEAFFLPPPYDLARKPGGKPLAVVFETALLRGVRRAARRNAAATGGAGCPPAVRRRALRARRPDRSRRARRRTGQGRRVGARSPRQLRPGDRVLRRERTRSVSRRRLSASVPCRLGARVRLERRDIAVSPRSSGLSRRAPSVCALRARPSISGNSQGGRHAPASDQQHHHQTEGCHGARARHRCSRPPG